MKKMPILAIIALLLVLAASCAFAATEPFNCPNCGGVGTGVVSSYIEYPTCVKGGTFSMFCNSCKTSYVWSGDNIDPDAHDFVYTVVNPTCTLDGHQGDRCTLCGTWADDATVIPATGHKWGGYTYSGTPGTHYQSCRNKGCDATQTLSCNYDNYGYRDYRGGVVHGHMCLDCWNWVDHDASASTEATCTTKAVCWCGLSFGEVLEHNPGTPVETPATCTTDGKIETKCTRCQTVLSTETISRTGHLMGGWEYSGTPGTHIDTCRNKGCTYTVSASCNYDNYGYRDYRGGVKHGHMCLDCWNWVDHTASASTEATCTTKAVCWCGLSFGEVLGHDLDNGVTTPATCTAAGKTVYTCQRPGCTYTETTNIPIVDHVEGDPVINPEATCCNTGLKSWYCVNCGKLLRTETIPALGHNSEGSYKWVRVSDPTCTEEGLEKKVCAHSGTDLGETRTIPALGHHYVGLWQVGESDSHYRDCYRCGAGRMNVDCDYLPLEIDDVMYQVCPVCGRFHDQKLEAVENSNVVLATGSKPGAFLVRMLAQPFGADEVRYPVIMTAIFEAGGRIADPAANVTTMQIEVPTDFSASFTLVFVSVDEATGELVWTEVPYTLENGKLTFTVEELGLFLFVAK